MKTRDSDAQVEVWSWKQAAYEQVKHLSIKEQINYFVRISQSTTDILAKKIKAKSKFVQ
jgi:hypothetical protein